jgi:hypothetical protein
MNSVHRLLVQNTPGRLLPLLDLAPAAATVPTLFLRTCGRPSLAAAAAAAAAGAAAGAGAAATAVVVVDQKLRADQLIRGLFSSVCVSIASHHRCSQSNPPVTPTTIGCGSLQRRPAGADFR